ncbi:translation initiation factor IF-3 [bacterium AH-315-J21]|nr:translation initiation factor IF-3 [bacterium AH-315-J21]
MARPREPRINERIRISPVRLVGAEGEQIGIVPINEALERARTADLDLVEVSSASRPPVCRIMDYGRFKYETAKKQKTARKKQHSMELKEMRFRPKVDTHDYEFKTKHIREFLEEGNKVKIFVMFRGREMAHTEFGRELLARVVEDMKEVATVEIGAKQEGRRMNMVLAPLASLVKKAADDRAAKVLAKEQSKYKNPKSEAKAEAEVSSEVDFAEEAETGAETKVETETIVETNPETNAETNTETNTETNSTTKAETGATE